MKPVLLVFLHGPGGWNLHSRWNLQQIGREPLFFLLSSASRALARVRSGRTGTGDSAQAPGGSTGSFRFLTSAFHLTCFGDYGFTKDLYQSGKTMQKNPSGVFCWKGLTARVLGQGSSKLQMRPVLFGRLAYIAARRFSARRKLCAASRIAGVPAVTIGRILYRD